MRPGLEAVWLRLRRQGEGHQVPADLLLLREVKTKVLPFRVFKVLKILSSPLKQTVLHSHFCAGWLPCLELGASESGALGVRRWPLVDSGSRITLHCLPSLSGLTSSLSGVS